MDHLFIECLLDGEEVSDIAAVRATADKTVRATYSEKILTRSFADGVPLDTALAAMKAKLCPPTFPSTFVLVSHKASPPLIKAVPNVFAECGWVYLNQMAWPLVWAQVVSAVNLEELAKAHKVGVEALESATGRVTATMNVYFAMMRRYKTALQVEETMTHLGGQALKSARDLLNF